MEIRWMKKTKEVKETEEKKKEEEQVLAEVGLTCV